MVEKTIEPKLFYRAAIINEIHCNMPSPGMLQALSIFAPNTMETHTKLREFLLGRNGLLLEKEDSHNPLVMAFNQPLNDQTFEKLLVENHKLKTDDFEKYLNVVQAQVFE